jgi:hypothetical protein
MRQGGRSPPPPVLCAERQARDARETAARRAAAPPYVGPIRRFTPTMVLYGWPDDVRDDEIVAYNAEQRRPWDYETRLDRRKNQ